MASNLLRNIPSVGELLEQSQLKSLIDKVSHTVVVSRVRTVLDELRSEAQHAAAERQLPNVSELADRIARRILQDDQPPLRPVINATGVLLHPGLGRAPLADAALEAMAAVGRDYASVELDLASGQPSPRGAAVESLIREQTGAEAALVVNNNAAATLLTLAALAFGREVVVSRGQLIEIDGNYRLPDVIHASGARLREVGATNKTHLADYRQAIHAATAAVLIVHPSNFRVIGCTETPSLEDLSKLGHERGLPVIDEIGCGALLDFGPFGFSDEPLARARIEAGADLVLFSGDKLLGGPQCGIIAGKRKYVDVIAAHPLLRAMQVDQLTLAALAATLRLYRDPDRARREIPLLHFLSTSPDNLRNRAERLAPQLAASPAIAEAQAVQDVTSLAGVSIPTQSLPTWCVALRPAQGSVDRLAAALRTGTPSLVGRVQQDRLLLDLRSVFTRQDQALVTAVQSLGKPPSSIASSAPNDE